MWPRALTLKTINPKVLNAQYAVRGAVAIKAENYKGMLRRGESIPFEKFYAYNVGNPQAVGMQPLSFPRQVASLVVNPSALDNPIITGQYPEDVVSRANYYVENCPGGVGAYSESKGHFALRQEVARYIAERDDDLKEVDPEHLFLTKGGSNAVEFVLQCLINDQNDGIMIPTPQYPLYSALVQLMGGNEVHYYLDNENDQWVLNVDHLQQQLKAARDKGINVRSLVIINPNNPAGSVEDKKTLEDVVAFCEQEKLVLLADEVYQHNIWTKEKEFHSLRKIVLEKDAKVELFSVHSASKGYYGECGWRGGYLECLNIDEEIVGQINKLASISLCSNIEGQLMLALVANPPQPGEPSFDLYQKERQGILDNMSNIADLVYKECNAMDNVNVSKIEGAMYAFPRIEFSQKAIEQARSLDMEVDLMYILEMLDETGIMFVPGSGFGQKPNTHHLRSTILGDLPMMQAALKEWKAFNLNFHNKYS